MSLNGAACGGTGTAEITGVDADVIDPVCRLTMTQRDDREPVGGLGIAAAEGGSVKSRRPGSNLRRREH